MSKWLYECIPVALVFPPVVFGSGYHRVVEPFGSAICLRVERCCCEVYETEFLRKTSENLGHELRAVVCIEDRKEAVWNYTPVDQDVCNRRRCGPRVQESSSTFWVMIHGYYNTLISTCRF